MEPSCFEPEGEAVPFWPPSSENPYEKTGDDEVLFDNIKYASSAFTRAPKIGNVVDSEDEAVFALANIDPWFQIGDLHIAQIGCAVTLPPSISLSPRCGHSETAVVNTLVKQKVIVRRLLPQSTYRSQHHYPIRAEFHTLEILHFKAQWKFGCQVPPKGAMFQALEVFRGCRGVGPSAVLCSDGATRSGLFVAAYLLTERLTRDRFLDLFHTLKALKLRRREVILSVQQLRFLYRLLISWVDEVMTIRGPRRPPEYQEEASRTSSRTNYRSHPGGNVPMMNKHCFDEYKRSIGSESEDNDEGGLRASPPRPVNVLYHYYSEELSRLLAGRSVSFDRNFIKGRLEERFFV
ncbi:unnamed protein product [Rodentolepis nana]|uniref:Tyrosine-protein phosphatase domain-containing protein n=1 Tax=Rodentolepis nana TaxID=102285 RepID=A0A0R3TUB6_RODNA|nr:unnamed protein product [Rodentolepis nana]